MPYGKFVKTYGGYELYCSQFLIVFVDEKSKQMGFDIVQKFTYFSLCNTFHPNNSSDLKCILDKPHVLACYNTFKQVYGAF